MPDLPPIPPESSHFLQNEITGVWCFVVDPLNQLPNQQWELETCSLAERHVAACVAAEYNERSKK